MSVCHSSQLNYLKNSVNLRSLGEMYLPVKEKVRISIALQSSTKLHRLDDVDFLT